MDFSQQQPPQPGTSSDPHVGGWIAGGEAFPLPSVAERDPKFGSKGSFSGSVLVGEYPGRVVKYESELEKKVVIILDARPEVVYIQEQVRFDWFDRYGEVHAHFFDFRVFLDDGSRLAIPVRPTKFATPQFLDELAQITAQAVPEFADAVCLFTEADIDPTEYENAEYLFTLKDSDPEADAAARRILRDVSGAATFQALSDAINMGPRGFRALGRLVRWGEAKMLRNEPIAPATLVGSV